MANTIERNSNIAIVLTKPITIALKVLVKELITCFFLIAKSLKNNSRAVSASIF